MSVLRCLFPLTILAVIVLSPQRGHGLGTEEFGNHELSEANYTTWPGILSVINDKARVYQVWVNGNERFHFKGTTASLNKALEHFSKIGGVEKHEVVFRVGPGQGASFNSVRTFVYDWDLQIYAGISAHVLRLDQGTKVWSTDPVLTVYVSDDIKLNEIVIPAGVTVIGTTQLAKRIIEGISRSKDSTVRGLGCSQLADLSHYDLGNLQEIGKRLDDEDKWVQLNATSSIAVFGRKVKDFLPKLRDLAKNDDEDLKRSSVKAIRAIEAAGDSTEAEAKHADALARIEDFIARHSK